MKSNIGSFIAFSMAALLIFANLALAGGPLYVTGYASSNPGQPFRWITSPIRYRTDLGMLGNQTNAQANTIVADSIQTWANVSTANVSFQNAGSFDADVTSLNIGAYLNSLYNCSVSSTADISIIYDVDGSIFSDYFGYDANSTLGVSIPACMDESVGSLYRSVSILNGMFIDGKPKTSTHDQISLAGFKATLIHELGHSLGLDHSQINLNCLLDVSCTADELAGVPIMFPILVDETKTTLTTDDIAAISWLYPKSSFYTNFGRIQGRVLFSDGKTPAQGYNVIARKVDDPKRTAVSSVSGFLFTSSAGNALMPTIYNSSYGSLDQTLIGYFDLPGLPPGTYTVEVEALNNGSYPFIDSSSVGPIGGELGFQYAMPGTCSTQYLKYPSSPSNSCSDYSTLTVGAGTLLTSNTDVIFLGTDSRYDSWEDGP